MFPSRRDHFDVGSYPAHLDLLQELQSDLLSHPVSKKRVAQHAAEPPFADELPRFMISGSSGGTRIPLGLYRTCRSFVYSQVPVAR